MAQFTQTYYFVFRDGFVYASKDKNPWSYTMMRLKNEHGAIKFQTKM